MRLRSLSAAVGAPALLLLPLIPTAAVAAEPARTGTLQVSGLDTFVGATIETGTARRIVADVPSADTVTYPAPGEVGPMVIGSVCFDPGNGPGLPHALVRDAAAGDCLTFQTVEGLDGALRFVVVEPRSPVDGSDLSMDPESKALRFDTTGVQFDLVTEGDIGTPALTSSTVAPGAALSGTAYPGSVVTVLTADGSGTFCTAEADADGAWSCTPETALEVGELDLLVAQRTAANQWSAAPAHVSVVAPPLASPVLTSDTDLTAGADQVVAGTADGATAVRVLDADGVVLCEAPVEHGRWTCTVDLAVGSHPVQLLAVHDDGRESAPVAAVLVVAAAVTEPTEGEGEDTGAPGDAGVPADGDDATTPVTPVSESRPVAPRADELAYTGTDAVLPAGIAAALLVVAGAALTVVRRRRHG